MILKKSSKSAAVAGGALAKACRRPHRPDRAVELHTSLDAAEAVMRQLERTICSAGFARRGALSSEMHTTPFGAVDLHPSPCTQSPLGCGVLCRLSTRGSNATRDPRGCTPKEVRRQRPGRADRVCPPSPSQRHSDPSGVCCVGPVTLRVRGPKRVHGRRKTECAHRRPSKRHLGSVLVNPSHLFCGFKSRPRGASRAATERAHARQGSSRSGACVRQRSSLQRRADRRE